MPVGLVISPVTPAISPAGSMRKSETGIFWPREPERVT